MWSNPFVHYEYALLSLGIKSLLAICQAKKYRQTEQTENTGRKKGGVRESRGDAEKQDGRVMLINVPPCDRVKIRNMG